MEKQLNNKPKKESPSPVSSSEIRHLLGRVEDEVVFLIEEIGATKSDLLETLKWIHRDEAGPGVALSMHPRVRIICEILEESEGEE